MSPPILLDAPDDPALLPGWLDGVLVSPALPRLVAQLEAVHGDPPAPRPLPEVLGRYADAVLEGGLARLSPGRLSALLRQPRLLVELRDLVFLTGGPYWDRVPIADAEVGRASRRASERAKALVPPAKAETLPAAEPKRAGRFGYVLTGAMSAAVAGLLFYTGVFSPRPPAVAGTFAQRVERVGGADDATKLAQLAGEFERLVPRSDDFSAVASALGEARGGCAVVQARDFGFRDAKAAEFVKAKCKAWAAAIDGQIAALESGERKPGEVREEFGKLMEKAGGVLRQGPA